MLFIFRKLRKSFFLPGKARTYLAYALGEIFLIVIGILIAVDIGDRNQQLKNNSFEVEILENLQADFVKNQQMLVEIVPIYEFVLEGADALSNIIGPEPKPATNAEIDEMMLAITYLPEYQPSDGVILSIIDSDNLSLIKNAEVRHQISRWPSRISDYKYILQNNSDKRDRFLFPFLVKHYAFKNIDSPYHRNDEDSSSFEVNYSDLLSNREFENLVELRRVNAVQLLDATKSLSEYQQKLLAAIEAELAN